MKNPYAFFALMCVAAAAAIYLLTAFILADLNFLSWAIEQRAGAVFMFVPTLLILAAISSDRGEGC